MLEWDSKKIDIKQNIKIYSVELCRFRNVVVGISWQLKIKFYIFDKGLITKQKKLVFKGWPVDHTGDRGKWAYSGTTD